MPGGRRRADDALRQSEGELSDFFEHATVALHWLDDTGKVLRANQAELDMLGYTAAEFVGRRLQDFETSSGVIDGILDSLRQRDVVRNRPAQLRCRDGSTRDVLISSSGRWDAGHFVHSRCVTLDVTERREADAIRGLLAAVVDSTEDAVISKSLDGVILSWNDGAAGLFGFTAAEVVGQSIDRLVPESLRAAERDLLARVQKGERVEPFETVRLARDGTPIDVSLALSPIRDDVGRIIGASSIARDIRPRKELEASLRESDRRKDEFLAVLAHELRNPLAPIRNAVAVLRLALPDDPRLQRAGDIIERQVRQMTRLLDDLLDVSRITHGKLDLERETVTLQSVLDLALETSGPLLETAGHTLSVDLPPDDVYIEADPVRMAQVFSNLLSNAAKYSDPGTPVRLVARRDGGEIVVSLTDHGIGIAPDTVSSLFEMFSQVKDARSRAQGGVGIGLALVKGLVEMHKGRVSVHSAGLGHGSTFEVRLLSARRPDAPTGTSAPEATVPIGSRVLIADDNRDGADSLALVVGSLGYDVRAVYSGADAVEAARHLSPHIVILDLGMPGMNGIESARHIRGLPGGRDLVLIALTGWGQERDRLLTAEAGFDAHLVKPIDPLMLRSLLHGFLTRD